MEIRKGIPASPGVGIAQALIIDCEDYPIPKRPIEPAQRGQEVQRVEQAFELACAELDALVNDQAKGSTEIKDIFAVHIRFLHDPTLRRQITDLINNQLVTAEFAVSTVLREIAAHFGKSKDPYISEREADVFDLERRLLRHLLGHRCRDLRDLDKEVVVVAKELSPTQTASFDKRFVRAIASDKGGRTSHSAIVARSLGIPAVVALEDFSEVVRPTDIVIVDGSRGIAIANPDPGTLAEYQKHLNEYIIQQQRLDSLRDKPALTRDGTKVKVRGNIEFPQEAQIVLDKGGEGIGLYRTEFLYLTSEDEPSEQQHYEAYLKVAQICQGRPIVIRTFDLGADKYSQRRRPVPERNPFLGLRSIRYCLQHLPMFRTQLRAILRASVAGDVRIMFPLVTNLAELRQAKLILRDVMEDLDDEGIPYNRDLKVGIMIETPAAAFTASTLAREADFFSIGTNDLIQYTLAVDRANEQVASLFSAAEPAVLRLIRTVIQDAYKARIEVSVCGEMASEPEYVMLLLGLGIRTLSVTAPMIPQVKQMIRSVTIQECNELARRVITMSSERHISTLLRRRASEVLPETV
ncbi:MAG: phosphoenolpyruvate--protein phosphotransferase [Sedimentisphaerales bacterium]|nr:phosphoenolpyruvate--protein phosphotransferase [Sedimentisphaerales bacterium]